MQMPAEAAVKPFEAAHLGSLLVGRFRDEAPNFFAVRTELRESSGVATPYMFILSSWVDNNDWPYLCAAAAAPTRILDLGHDWSIDVSIDETAPAFSGDPSNILVRSGTGFYLRLAKEGLDLDLARGELIERPAAVRVEVSWPAFAIYLTQPGMDGPGTEIFHWPRK